MPDTSRTAFRVSDFDRLGRSDGFRYRLPNLSPGSRDTTDPLIAHGEVTPHAPSPGLSLVFSDIQVHESYESSSSGSATMSAVVLLQGRVVSRLDTQAPAELQTRRGLSIITGDASHMHHMHPAGQRIRSVSLQVTGPHALADERLQGALGKAWRRPRHQAWHPPAHLLQALEHGMQRTWSADLRDLLLEGVALQMLAHALAADASVDHADTPGTRDRRLLQRVIDRLEAAPGDAHTLDDLARVACMSPSSLRAKFKSAYGKSVFAWIRDRRMDLARERLAQGWTVQQAAAFVGFSHPSNFATAYRARFGTAPSHTVR